jgi:hypothetical protein
MVLLLASGCGGSDSAPQTDSGSESTVELSKAEFVNKASIVCKAAQERTTEEFGKYIQKNRIPTSGPGVAVKAADAFRVVFRPAIEKEIDVLDELSPPAKDEQEVDKILAAMQQGLEEAEDDPLEFIQTSSTFEDASRLAIAYGIPACSTNSK